MIGKAVHRYDMFHDGDRVVLALSGGKDSLSLLWLLNERLAWIPIRYQLYPVHIDPGFDAGYAENLRDYCDRIGFTLTVVTSDDGPQAHSKINRENPCFLCARRRRMRLFETARQLGCDKIAMGHNKDDLIETLFLNICYGGEISTMRPAQTFFDGRLTVVRPLAFADEDKIKRFAREMAFPEFVNPCPSAGRSKRNEIKTMLQTLYAGNDKIKGNIFQALHHVKSDYLLI